MGCNGICTRPEYNCSQRFAYLNGNKRCQICERVIKVPEDCLWCPCCGYRLRTKPRNLKYKQRLRKELGQELVPDSQPNRKILVGMEADGVTPILKDA